MKLLCPKCGEILNNFYNRVECSSEHKYNIVDEIVDLLPDIDDSNLLEEESHWDGVAARGGMLFRPSNFINKKILGGCCETYKNILKQQLPEYEFTHLNIAEMGCGDGSIFKFFPCVQFRSVNYVGVDVSLKMLRTGVLRKVPDNWKTEFVRATSNSKIFSDNQFDIVYCAAALHHLEYNKALSNISNAVKSGGLLIINEPSIGNPIAKIGRKLVKGFHTPGEKPLNAKHIRKAAEQSNFDLVYEKGFCFINGPLEFLLGFSKVPKPIEASLYYLLCPLDKAITSPYWSYLFIQAYKKR